MTKKELALREFRTKLFDEIQIYFKENFPNVKLVVKQVNLDQRIRVSSLSDPWLREFKKHNLCFRVLISKSNSPFINKTLYLFLKSIFAIMAEQQLEEDVKNLEVVKMYFPLINIMMI